MTWVGQNESSQKKKGKKNHVFPPTEETFKLDDPSMKCPYSNESDPVRLTSHSDGKSGVFFLAGGVRVFLRNQKWGKWGFGGLIPHLRCILTKLGCFESRKNITRTTTTIPNRKQKNLSSTDLDFHLSSDFI
jgi:hypothetical protein